MYGRHDELRQLKQQKNQKVQAQSYALAYIFKLAYAFLHVLYQTMHNIVNYKCSC